jgi:hypothetical protein
MGHSIYQRSSAGGSMIESVWLKEKFILTLEREIFYWYYDFSIPALILKYTGRHAIELLKLVALTWTQSLDVTVIVCIRLDTNRFSTIETIVIIKLNANDYSDI